VSKGDSQHDTAVGVGSLAGGVALAMVAAVNPVAALAGIAALTAAAIAAGNRKG